MTARRPAESLAEQSYVRKVQSLKHNSADWLVRPRPRHPVAGRASMLLYALLGLIGYAEARGGGWGPATKPAPGPADGSSMVTEGSVKVPVGSTGRS